GRITQTFFDACAQFVEELQLRARIPGRCDSLMTPLHHALGLGKCPGFSVWLAAGMKKTSVPISSVLSSPVSISGPSFHHVGDSMSWKSRTTNHLRLAIPIRCIRPLAEPT